MYFLLTPRQIYQTLAVNQTLAELQLPTRVLTQQRYTEPYAELPLVSLLAFAVKKKYFYSTKSQSNE